MCVWCVYVCLMCVYVCVVWCVCVFLCVCVCVKVQLCCRFLPVSCFYYKPSTTPCCALAATVCVWSGYCFIDAGVDFESSFPSGCYILIICYFFCKFKLLYQAAHKPNDTRCLTPILETPGISSRWHIPDKEGHLCLF